MNEDDFAASDTKMRLIEVTSTSNGVDSLPQVGLTRRAQSDGLRTASLCSCGPRVELGSMPSIR
jgi:hypothetical protein